jgi:translation elongation factor P/translation initiation factor 5A
MSGRTARGESCIVKDAEEVIQGKGANFGRFNLQNRLAGVYERLRGSLGES